MSGIDDIAPPPPPRRPPPPPRPQYRLDQGALKGTRWLYDSEAEFQRAQKQVAIEEAHEEAKKQLVKKRRLAKAKELVGKPVKKLQTIPAHATTVLRAHRKKAILGLAGLLIGSILIFAFMLQMQTRSTPQTTEVLNSNQSASPAFPTVAPGGDISRTQSGKLGYDPDKKVASYTDAIAGTPVTISQQALPERFQPDPTGELAKFAEEINAKEKHEVGDVIAYSGLSAKGPQTTILIKNQLLVFIAADKELPDDALKSYIASLK
jgi:hypothetical protein